MIKRKSWPSFSFRDCHPYFQCVSLLHRALGIRCDSANTLGDIILTFGGKYLFIGTMVSYTLWSDLAVGLLIQPLLKAIIPSSIPTITLLFNILLIFFCCASFITITAITIDQMFVLQPHLRNHVVVATFRITGVVIFSYRWIFSVVNTLLLILHYLISYEYQPSRRKVRCLFQNLPHYSLPSKTDSALIRTAAIVEQSRHFSGNKIKETEIPFNTFLLYSLRLFCYMPYSLVTLYGAISPVVYFPTMTLGSSVNSSLNPCTVCEIAKFAQP